MVTKIVAGSSIGLGAQSIKHANVLSEKTNFSALGGPKVAIFGGDLGHCNVLQGIIISMMVIC